MLWILRSRPHLCRVPHRPFSFTANLRFPRIPGRHGADLGQPKTYLSEKITSSNAPEPFIWKIKPLNIRNQVLFFVFGSLVTFGIAARQTNENTYYWTNKICNSGISWRFRSPDNDELRRARYLELGGRFQAGVNRLHEAMSGWSQDLKAMVVYSYAQIAQSLLNVSEGTRLCYLIGAVNGIVWLAWRIPGSESFMMRSFAHNPLSGLSYTMLTSMFSHHSFIHFLFNTMALTSFGAAANLYLTRQQQNDPSYLRESTTNWHFLAFFISAGLFSGLVSHVATARLTYPRLVSQLTSSGGSSNSTASSATAAAGSAVGNIAEKISSVIKPSLGASGAIYATVTMTAMAFPDNHITLIFPPTPPIPIQYGVFGLMAIDLLGVLRGWKVFDHYAHLGGAMFGLWYYAYGPQVWESFRIMTLGALPASFRAQ